MAEGRKKITQNKTVSTETKKRRLASKLDIDRYDKCEYDTEYCFNGFLIEQVEKGNSKATIQFYQRFYKKYTECKMYLLQNIPLVSMKQLPIVHITDDTNTWQFMYYLETVCKVNKQTVNSYLRGYRAFGKWCEEEGYIDGFKCQIKEVEPPVKEVYTDAELDKLMKKPEVADFTNFRAYCIISLILATGARSNTILNIRISDFEADTGYINFNTTKAHKVVRLGLPKKTRLDLIEWLNFWRLDKDAEPNDFLFCNEYGEQMSRSTLDKAIAKYNNKRGVEKTSIHLLRHTFAKNWITSGGDIISLARVLTHSELEMVKRYSNLYAEDVKEEIEEHSTISQLKTKSGKTIKNQKKRLSDK